MRKTLKVSIFLCDGYSLTETATFVRHLQLVSRSNPVQFSWRLHAIDHQPAPIEPLNLAAKQFHPLSESARSDVVVLSLPEDDSAKAESSIRELKLADISWKCLVLLGTSAPVEGAGDMVLGSSIGAAEEALSAFELPGDASLAPIEVNPLSLLGLDSSALSPVVEEALAMMARSIASPVPIEQLCLTLGIVPRQLHRRFTQEIGEAPQATYRKIRIEMGRCLLEETDIPITTIAHDCGFADGPHFARCFKGIHGLAPQAYRENGLQPAIRGATPTTELTIVGVENHTYKSLNVLEEFSRRVYAASKGEIHLRILSHLDLGLRTCELLSALDSSVADAALVFPEMLPHNPQFAALLPQGVLHCAELNEHLRRVQEPVVLEALAPYGLGRLCPMSDYEYQNFWFFSNAPVRSVRDLKQRSLGHWSELGASAFSALDVSTTKLSYGDVYGALSRGQLDVALGLPCFAAGTGLADVARYATPAMAVTRNYPSMITAKQTTLDGLSRKHLGVIQRVGAAMLHESDMKWRSGLEDERSLSRLKREGVTFLDRIPTAALMDIESSMVESWVRHCNELGDEAARSCDAIRAVVHN